MHSQHVLDRINSEVKPLFQTYDLQMIKDGNMCTLNNFGMIEDQLRQFGHKKTQRSNHQCSLCNKNFESEDYLEFHMKQAHFRDKKLQSRYQDRGMICPAELCDIFECPEISEKKLRL